jgi:hypothetical protein
MSAHRALAFLAPCALLVGLLATPVEGQIAVLPVQNLSFGQLRAGQAELVSPDDRARRGEFEIVGSGRVTITLILPTQMVSAGGSSLPLSFGKDDVTLEFAETGRDRTFNPSKPHSVNIKKKEGGASLHIGGLALPAASQPPGHYGATLTIQIVASET